MGAEECSTPTPLDDLLPLFPKHERCVKPETLYLGAESQDTGHQKQSLCSGQRNGAFCTTSGVGMLWSHPQSRAAR